MSGIPTLPEGFNEKLIEVVDPKQSIDYLDCTSGTFPVRVPTISLERKLVRIQRIIGKKNSIEALERSAAEIVNYYRPELGLEWSSDNLSEQEIGNLVEGHLLKCQYNDEVIKIVSDIEKSIEWHQPDKDEKEGWKKYVATSVFLPAMGYANYMSDRYHPRYFLDNTTRGLWELMKLAQLISSDRLAAIRTHKTPEPVEDEPSKKTTKAKTMEEYLAEISGQGVSLRDIAG